MKPVTVVFLAGHVLDVVTTLLGFALVAGMRELNPLARSVPVVAVAKVFSVTLVAVVLERKREWPRAVWAVPLPAWIAVFWNTWCILVSL